MLICKKCNKNEIDSVYGYCVECLSYYGILARLDYDLEKDLIENKITQEFYDAVQKTKFSFNFIADMEKARMEFTKYLALRIKRQHERKNIHLDKTINNVDDKSFFQKVVDSFTRWMNSQVFVKK